MIIKMPEEDQVGDICSSAALYALNFNSEDDQSLIKLILERATTTALERFLNSESNSSLAYRAISNYYFFKIYFIHL